MRESDSTTQTRLRRRPGKPLAITLCALVVVLGACGETSALSRAAGKIAALTGKSADEVIAKVRLKLPGASEDAVLRATERAASETDWMVVLAAQREEQVKTARAVHGATCRIVQTATTVFSVPADQRDKKIGEVVSNYMKAEALPAETSKFKDIVTAVNQHVLPLLQDGVVRDPAGALLDLGCLFEVP
jgi:ribosomal protein L12E/L44/L45/RPP1/RPP2